MAVDGHKFSDTKSSPDKKALTIWAATLEVQMREPGAIQQAKHVGTTVGQVLIWYKEDFQGATKFGRSKLSHID